LEEEEPLAFDSFHTTCSSGSDPDGLGFDFDQQAQTNRHRDHHDPAQFQKKRTRRPQFLEQDLGLGGRSVLTEQSVALREERRRTNSQEHTGKMAPGLGGGMRSHGKKHHNQVVYKNGQGEIVDLTEPKDCVKLHHLS
jgi:hypothetical protein